MVAGKLRHTGFPARQSFAGNSPFPFLSGEEYPEARHLATQAMALRLVYGAMREGIFGSEITLSVKESDGSTLELKNAQDLYEHICTSDSAKIMHLTLHNGKGDEAIEDINTFVNNILREQALKKIPEASEGNNWRNFQYEILDSLNHEVLAVCASRQFNKSLEGERVRHHNLWDWMVSRDSAQWLKAHHHDLDSFLLQLAAFRGHPLHPSSKVRLLLDPKDPARRYSLDSREAQQFFPEFAHDVGIMVYAVKADRITASLSESSGGKRTYVAYIRANFPQAYVAWRKALARRVGKAYAREYVPVPVHPLQREEIQSHFAEALAQGEIVPLPEVIISLRPTLSARTLTPVSGNAPQIKLSLNMQMTSVVRTLAPARVFNAPVYSDLIQNILKRDHRLSQVLRPIQEQASIYYGKDSNPESKDYQDGYQLAAVFKQNPGLQTSESEIRVPVAALLHASPFSGEPVILDIMHAAGIKTPEQAVAYFNTYARIVVGAEVGMLSRYGVGLEGHQQNDDMIFSKDSGQPKAVMYRDINGGMEASETLLKLNGYNIASQIHPVRKGLYSDITVPLEQTTHTTFYSHLFPLVAILAKAYGVPKEEFYDRIRKAILNILKDAEAHYTDITARLPDTEQEAANGAWKSNLQEIQGALLSREMETKCLLTMRLGGTQAMAFTHAENPLVQQPR
jgi:siderophore synthetase component